MALGTVTEELNDLKAVELRIESTGKQGVSLQQKQLAMFTDFFEQMRLDALKRQEAEDEAKKKAALALKTAQKDKKGKKDKDKGGFLFGLPMLFGGFFAKLGEIGSRLINAMKNFRVNLKNLFSKKGLGKFGTRVGRILFGTRGFVVIQEGLKFIGNMFKFYKDLYGRLSKPLVSVVKIIQKIASGPKAAAAVAGFSVYMGNFVKAIKSFPSGVTLQNLKIVGGKLKGIFDFFKWLGKLPVKGVVAVISVLPKVAKVIDGIIEFFRGVAALGSLVAQRTKGISTAVAQVPKVINGIKGAVGIMIKPFQLAFDSLRAIGTRFAGMAKTVASGSKSAGKVGGLLGKLFTFMRGFGGKLLSFFPPIRIALNIFETIKGALDGFKAFSGGSMFEKIIGGLTGALGGLLVGTVGILADFAKNVISWLLRKVGLGGIADMLDSFSFVHIIQDFFAGMATFVTDVFSNLFAGFKDGIGPGIMGILASMTRYVKKLLMLPLALIAGGVGALANLFSKKGPKQGFMDAFGKVFNFGDDKLMTKAQKENMYGKGGTRANPMEGSRKARAEARALERERKRAEKAEKKLADKNKKNTDASTGVTPSSDGKTPATVINNITENSGNTTNTDASTSTTTMGGGTQLQGQAYDTRFNSGGGMGYNAYMF